MFIVFLTNAVFSTNAGPTTSKSIHLGNEIVMQVKVVSSCGIERKQWPLGPGAIPGEGYDV